VLCHLLTWIWSKVEVFRVCCVLMIKTFPGNVVTQTVLDPHVATVYMWQKIWQLVGTRQSYCNNNKQLTFWATLYKRKTLEFVIRLIKTMGRPSFAFLCDNAHSLPRLYWGFRTRLMLKFGTYVWNLTRKNPFVGGQSPIRLSLFLPQFTPNWHLHNAFSMGVLKHFSDVVYGPIIAVNSSNDRTTWLGGCQSLNVKRG